MKDVSNYGADQGLTKSYVAADVPPPAPLTEEMMRRTVGAKELAQEIRGRLYSVRDRLFGPQPEGGAQGASKPVSDSFQAAWDEQQSYLMDTLYAINNLSLELANRL